MLRKGEGLRAFVRSPGGNRTSRELSPKPVSFTAYSVE